MSIEHKLGIHGSPTCVMAYGDKDGAIGYLVGEENRGLEYMFTMMNFARLEVGIEGVAIAERAYQRALGYAKERVQGRPIGVRGGERVTIIHHPDVRRMLMTMKAQTEAMRALAAAAVARRWTRRICIADRNERLKHQAVFDLLTPVVKGWCTEQCIEIASLGVQVHGGMGFVEETGAAQHLRDARITTIYEGTTGIQANDLIGRKLAAEKGMTAKALIAQMRAFDKELAGYTHPALAVIRRALADGVARTRRGHRLAAGDLSLQCAGRRRRRGAVSQAVGNGGRRLADGARRAHRQGTAGRRRRGLRLLSRQDRHCALLRRAHPAAGAGLQSRHRQRLQQRAGAGGCAALSGDE